MDNLERELAALLNKYSQEQPSNTPDFILANYLLNCLASFDGAVKERAKWYGRMDVPGARVGVCTCDTSSACVVHSVGL